MLHRLCCLCLLFCCPLISWARPESGLSLAEAFQRAVQQSEQLAMKDEDINVAAARYRQALGTALPQLSGRVAETVQDTAGGGDPSSIGSTFTRRSRPEVALTLRQPLFQGLREFVALRNAGTEARQNRLLRHRAEQLLYADVARAYYAVLEAEAEVAIHRELRDTFARRVAEIQERIDLGRSRESERFGAEAQLAGSDAELEGARGRVRDARDLLGFLTGHVVTERLHDRTPRSSGLPPLAPLLATAAGRSDVDAQAEAARRAKGQVAYERGGYLPTAELQANYYPYRAGYLSDIKWDATVALNVPIFQGGTTRGKVREATAKWLQSKLAHQEVQRRAQLEVRQQHDALRTARHREHALHRAAAKAGANYWAQAGEYHLGLVTNLDVLQALRDWQTQRLAANAAHFQTKVARLLLDVAAGETPSP
ncbi:MAG: TolC family protein [Deltaproteobacteria bacterium]|nr:TolC family protein [Deltaproteobacteria bacterium]